MLYLFNAHLSRIWLCTRIEAENFNIFCMSVSVKVKCMHTITAKGYVNWGKQQFRDFNVKLLKFIQFPLTMNDTLIVCTHQIFLQ